MRFSLNPTQPGTYSDLPLSIYENTALQVNTSVNGMTVLELSKPISTASLITDFTVRSYTGKAVSEDRIPDIWCTNPLPTVSERCRTLIEHMDPDTHQFVPITIRDAQTNTPLHGQYYSLICGRLLEITPKKEPASAEQTDIYGMSGQPTSPSEKVLGQIVAHLIEIREFLQNLPLWRLNTCNINGAPIGEREVLYTNEALIRNAGKHGLKGFKVSSKGVWRDVHRVCD